MEQAEPNSSEMPVRRRRQFDRHELQCRAKIRIGSRHYAGYVHNISRGGAKLRTISPIRKIGHVVLTLPGLPPVRCRLKWTDSYNAGVAFGLPISESAFWSWVQTRSGCSGIALTSSSEVAEVTEFVCR